MNWSPGNVLLIDHIVRSIRDENTTSRSPIFSYNHRGASVSDNRRWFASEKV